MASEQGHVGAFEREGERDGLADAAAAAGDEGASVEQLEIHSLNPYLAGKRSRKRRRQDRLRTGFSANTKS